MFKFVLQAAFCFSLIFWTTASAGDLFKVIENHRFLFKVPLDFTEVEVQGVDSFVKQYESDSISLSFDYGWYSSNFNRWPDDTVFQDVVIFGKSARIGTVKAEFDEGFPYTTKVHFILDKKMKLSMFAACKTMDDVGIAHRIFKSILFKES